MITKNTTLLVRALNRTLSRNRRPTTKSTERNSSPLSRLKVHAHEAERRNMIETTGRSEAAHNYLTQTEDLAGVVTGQFAKVKSITRTMTLIAFKC
jgi:hypothetical protein